MRGTAFFIIGAAALSVLSASFSHAANYMCGQDLNNDGYVDAATETAPCIGTSQGQLCPVGAVDCTPYDICPLGNYACNNGACTEPGVCSSTQVPVTQYQCPITGQIYDDSTACNNNCSQTANCTSSQQCLDFSCPAINTTLSVSGLNLPVHLNDGRDGDVLVVWGRYNSWNNFNIRGTYQCQNGTWTLTGTDTSSCGSGWWACSEWCPSGYSYSPLLQGFQFATGYQTTCYGGGDGSYFYVAGGGYSTGNICTISYTCPLGSQYLCSGGAPTCTEQQACVTYNGTTAKYQCSLTGTIYDTQNQCTTGCFQTAACNTGYSCPLGNYTCMDNGGTYQCSPNQCVDLATTLPQGTDYNSTSYQNDGQVDSQGNCAGEFYIFNGAPSQCRPVGTQTSFYNCCSNNDGKTLFIQKTCKDEEWQTNASRDAGRCHYIGDYCKEKWWLIGCVQKAMAYCCFNSKLGRIIHEQGRPQLKPFGSDGGWGTPEAPECRGFKPDEFQMLDFSKIDLSEFYNDIQSNLPLPADVKQGAEQKIYDYYQNVR